VKRHPLDKAGEDLLFVRRRHRFQSRHSN
jgi:hypothetical protein